MIRSSRSLANPDEDLEGSLTVVRPHVLRADTLCSHALDTVTDLSTVVRANASFHGSFVVVDEEAGRHEVWDRSFLDNEVFEGTGDGVCCAATDLALIIDGRPGGGTEVNQGRQFGNGVLVDSEVLIPMIREVCLPAILGCAADKRSLGWRLLAR